MKTSLVGNTQLVAGNADSIPAVLAILEEAGIETTGNADVYVRTYQHFGVDEARELRERAGLRPALGKRRVFVVTTPDINREAQNALLKTLEEPPADALFVFILPAPETLLPTFRSRTQTLVLEEVKKAAGLVDAKAFLAAQPQKRLDMLKPLLEKGEDDKRDVGAILSFLAALERSLAKKPDGLEPVYRARKYITDKGALVKPLLEQVALLVPHN